MPKLSRNTVAVASLALVMVAGGGAIFAVSQATDKVSGTGNARALNGYQARDLVKAGNVLNTRSLNDFDPGCTFTTVLTATVKAPVNGYILAWGSAAAARDTNFPDPAELVARLKSGPKIISGSAATQLATDGSWDGNVSVSGIVKVLKGKRTIHLQLAECSSGDSAAFVTARTITTQFVPFGTSKVLVPTVAKLQPSNN